MSVGGIRRRSDGATRLAAAGAVIFDLDGVIVDSEPWWFAVREVWAARHGTVWTEADNRACMGLASRAWASVMRERTGVDLAPAAIEAAIIDALVARYAAEAVPVIPGAPAAVIQIAARLPVALASSAPPAVISAALRATGLGATFRAVVSSDDVAAGKPAPDVFLEAARRLGVNPERCVVVEDSRNGVLAGSAAGMYVVLVPNASAPPAPGAADAAHVILGSLAELGDRLPSGPGS